MRRLWVLIVLAGGVVCSAAVREVGPETLREAVEQARAGDVIRLGPVVYRESKTLVLGARGTAEKPIRIEALGERAVIDFAEEPEERSAYGVHITGAYWELVNIEVRHAGSYGIYVPGEHNRIERCAAAQNRSTGMQVDEGGAHNLFVECESFRNFDRKTKGENADGFAAKHKIGPGNVFRGCRAYQNADDGWDLWMASEPVVLEDCVSFRNGYNIWKIADYQGDGNGFKFGGNYVPMAHVARRCIAVECPLSGFDQNHNVGAIAVEDCVAIRCGIGFSFPETPREGKVVLRRNASFGCQNILELTVVSENNLWWAEIPGGNLGPPPRPGHRDLPGAGAVPRAQMAPNVTKRPSELAEPPRPQDPEVILNPKERP